MNKRDWWMVGAGADVMGALVGALAHSITLVLWNLIWLGVSIYAIQGLDEKK